MNYDTIGIDYHLRRIPDARIASALHAALGDDGSVVNVGAGAGSYEPAERCLVAIEPSMTMIRQRPASAVPAVQALAAQLPLRDACSDVAMAILTIHHWQDRAVGLSELGRVARDRVVILTWDPDFAGFWLTDNYFPRLVDHDRHVFPPISELRRVFTRLRVEPLAVPYDCTDGFLGAYWRRPWAYLDSNVRSGMSTFSKIQGVDEGLTRLRQDLETGEWQRRYAYLLDRSSLDLGYRLISVDLR